MAGYKTLAALIGSTSFIAAGAAVAQDLPAFDLGTLVLYGDRATQDASQTNASVAVVGEEVLSMPEVASYRDSFRRIANVNTGDFTESGFVIRGVNSEGLTPGGIGAPLASFYIDGVQQTVEGTRRGLRGTFDVEQIEVYRGPQSTLTGRNALAGAIYLRTKDPEFEPSARAQLTYGEDNHRQVALAYGNALGDKLAFRFSGEWSQKDTDLNYPSYERFQRYGDFKTDDYHNLRAKLLWLPTGSDETKVLLSYSHSFDGPTSNDIAGPNWSSNAPLYGARRGDIWGTILPDDPYRLLGLTEIPAFQDVRETTVKNFGIEVSHEFSNALKLTSMTGWTNSVTDRHSINHGTPGEFLTVDGEFDQEILSQELRLNYDDGPLRWVAGLYVSEENQSSFRTQQLLTLDESRNSAKITNLAAFGEISYEFVPGWRAIAGARVDHVDQKQTAFFSQNGVMTSNTTASFEDTVVLPKFGLEHSFAGNQRVSLTYQEGYRPGGSGVQASTGMLFEYEPESARNYELAWRGRFMEDRLGVAVNLFYQDWDKQQVEVWADPLNPASSYITNAGKSESYGGEIELTYAATERLDLYGSIGLLETEFKDFSAGGINYSGLSFPGAPETNISLGFQWGGEIGWFANGSATYTGSSMSRIEQGLARPLTLDDYTTVDVSFGYGWNNGARMTVYATNLLDEKYFKYEYGPGAMATLGDRREVGVRLDYTF